MSFSLRRVCCILHTAMCLCDNGLATLSKFEIHLGCMQKMKSLKNSSAPLQAPPPLQAPMSASHAESVVLLARSKAALVVLPPTLAGRRPGIAVFTTAVNLHVHANNALRLELSSWEAPGKHSILYRRGESIVVQTCIALFDLSP